MVYREYLKFGIRKNQNDHLRERGTTTGVQICL